MSTAPAVPAEVDAEVAASQEAENILALDPVQAAVVRELQFVKAEKKRLADRDEFLTGEVKKILGKHKGATVLGKLLVSLTPRAGRRTADMTKLATDYPEAFAACVTKGADVQVLHFHR
jgi:hypothetical protein